MQGRFFEIPILAVQPLFGHFQIPVTEFVPYKLITETCPYCPQVATIVNNFAIASKGKIRSVIIDIVANPDIGQYYDAAGVPYTIINDQKTIVGMVGAPEILKALIGSNIRVQY